MSQIDVLTGQAGLFEEILRLAQSTDRPAIVVRGPSGSGKTWLAQSTARAWSDLGHLAFVARGEDVFARRPLFPLLTAVASETAREQSKTTRTVALAPVTAIPFGGRPLREILTHFFERNDAAVAAKTPHLRQEDREILLRMQKTAGSRRCLLICDNIQSWDQASLEFLALAMSGTLGGVFPFLDRLVVLATLAEVPPTLQPASAILRAHHWRELSLPLCSESAFPLLLAAFGVTRPLPTDVVQHLYAITGGHLELVRRIAEAEKRNEVVWDRADNRPAFLFDLLERRLESLSAVPEDTVSVLRAAAVIGLSFSEHELGCLLDGREKVKVALEPAERLRLLEGGGEVRRFVHGLVRDYYLGRSGGKTQDLHAKFAECLRLLHSGDYARRAEHLRRAGNPSATGEVLVLECLRVLRGGTFAPVDALRDELDAQQISFLSAMHDSQRHFDDGVYDRAIDVLNGIEDLHADSLLAERDILAARAHIKRLSRPDREQAIRILERWSDLKSAEPDVWARTMIYRVVSCVFLGDELQARDLERALYRDLSRRAAYDSTARRTINHLRLKSNMLHSAHVARARLEDAIEFFGGAPTLDPVHQAIGLVNLAANYLVEAEYEHAFAACQRAETLIQGHPTLAFPRVDILLTNLTISAYLSGHLSAVDALDAASSIWRTFGPNNDAPLLAANKGYFLARLGRFDEAVQALEPIYRDLLARKTVDGYYTYFVGNNLCGALFEGARRDESIEVWNTIGAFIPDAIGPSAPYLRARHELQSDVFTNNGDWDKFLSLTSGPRVGPGWAHYGRGFLPCELEFWSDE